MKVNNRATINTVFVKGGRYTPQILSHTFICPPGSIIQAAATWNSFFFFFFKALLLLYFMFVLLPRILYSTEPFQLTKLDSLFVSRSVRSCFYLHLCMLCKCKSTKGPKKKKGNRSFQPVFTLFSLLQNFLLAQMNTQRSSLPACW